MILKHRDRELLHFDWIGDVRVRVDRVNDAERRFLPLEFGKERFGDPDALRYPLEDWLASRSAPVGRHFIRNLMDSLGLNINSSSYSRRVLEISRGLSLNDVYWVVSDGFTGTWAECNLYDNRFSEAMAEIAFTGRGRLDPRKASTSPEMTTNGMLPKCWVREEDGIYLYKGGTGADGGRRSAVEGLEPYSEFYAAQVAETLGLRHVKYELAKYKGRLCSKCKLFTSERYGYLPASKLPDRDVIANDVRFLDMFVFDALIYNVDRHFGNFGYLIDNDANEIVDVAPIFDNGNGFLPHLDVSARSAANNYYSIRNYVRDKHPAVFRHWLDIPYDLTEDLLERVSKLEKFHFKKHRHYNWTDERLKVLAGFLQKRASDICKFRREVAKKDEQSLLLESAVSNENVGVKTSGGSGLNASEQRATRLILRNSSVTEEEIANQLGVTIRQVERIIATLKKKAGLRRRGTDKVGEWYFDT